MLSLITARNIILLWQLGFIGSLIIQTIFQGWFGSHSLWGINNGWQNEIAIWNVGMFLVIANVLKTNESIKQLLFPLALLSLMFAINHSIALVTCTQCISHWMGAIANYLGVFLYVIYVIKLR